MDCERFADGPWTPESLAEAISAIDGNREDLELRSVQVWFQDSDNGVSDANIRSLARVFGCGDPEAESAWQAELKAAKEGLAKERREKKRRQDCLSVSANGVEVRLETPVLEVEPTTLVEIYGSGEQTKLPAGTFAEKYEQMLGGATSLNLQFGYLLVFCGLGLMNYILGTLSVTYSPYVP